MKACFEYEALLDLYVDGELDPEAMGKVRDHLDTCPACRAYADDAFAIRRAFPDEDAVELPEGFHEGVMAAVAAAAPQKGRRSWQALGPLAAACLALVVAVGGGGKKAEAPAAAQYAYSAAATAEPAAPATAMDEDTAENRSMSVAPTAAGEPAERFLEVAGVETASDAVTADGALYFAELTVTAEQAEAHLGDLSPITLSDGRTAYELTGEAYTALLTALGTAETEAKQAVPSDGLALVIIQD